MSPSTPLSEHLERLAEFEGTTGPFISLYLNAQPDDRGRDNFATFLKNELRRRAATYAVDTPARDSLERDIARIEAYLATELKPSSNGIAIFACAAEGDFFEAVQLDAPIDEHRLHISDRPHLYPLARLDARYPRCAAVLCDTNRARIFVLALARIEQAHEVTGTKTRRHQMGGWSQARYQRHIDNYHQQHIKEVVDTLDRIVRQEEIPHIVLFGDAVAIPMLQRELPPHLAELVIDVASLPTGSNEPAVLDKTLEALHRHHSDNEREKVEELLGAYRSGGLGVAGLEDVRLALETGQVDELFIADPAANRNGDETLAPDDRLARDVLDELVSKAQRTSASVTVVEDPSRLDPLGGVGALLRYRVPGLQRTDQESPAGVRS